MEQQNAGRPGAVDRALRLFGDVRAGEGGTVLLMCLNVSLLLVAYYILKTVREPLILLAGGAELKSYAAAAQALRPHRLRAALRLAGAAARPAAVPGRGLLFFVGCIELFFLGGRIGVPHLGFLFFVWVGIFSLTTIAQFWSYANEHLHPPRRRPALPADRGRVHGGGPAGGGAGRRLFAHGVEPVRDDADRGRPPAPPPRPVPRRERRQPPRGGRGPRAAIGAATASRLVLKSRYLLLIAALLVLLNVVNTVGEFILGPAVVTMADAHAAVRARLRQAGVHRRLLRRATSSG